MLANSRFKIIILQEDRNVNQQKHLTNLQLKLKEIRRSGDTEAKIKFVKVAPMLIINESKNSNENLENGM